MLKMSDVDKSVSVLEWHDAEIKRLSDFLIQQMMVVIKNLEKTSDKSK